MKSLKRFNSLSVEVKASVAYTICSILTRCLSFISLPIFTRIMTKDEYGVSTVYASSAAIVVIFTSLQLPYGTLSTAMIKFKDDRDGYLSSLCSISFFLTLVYFAFCFVFKRALVEWLDLPLVLVITMGIEMLFSTSRMAWMGRQRFEYKYKSVVLVTVGTSAISLLVSLLVVSKSENKGMAKVLSNATVVSLVGLVFFFLLLIKGKKPFEKKFWKFAMSFNVPLIPYYLSQVVFNQSDRLMINKICGKSDAAIYGVAYSLATIITFVVTSIHSSYTPWIFERIDRKEVGDNRRVSMFLSASIAFLLLGIIVLAPEVVLLMAGRQYMDAIWVVPPVAMSVLLLYYADLFDCLLFFYESKFFLTIAAIAAAIVNLILNYIYIPMFGFIAAAYTTLFSYMMLATVDYLYMLKICKQKGIDKSIYSLKGLVGIFLTFAGLGFIAMALYGLPIVRYAMAICGLIFAVCFRKKIVLCYNNLKKGASI